VHILNFSQKTSALKELKNISRTADFKLLNRVPSIDLDIISDIDSVVM
jgi:hypothetical protein